MTDTQTLQTIILVYALRFSDILQSDVLIYSESQTRFLIDKAAPKRY